ncbi:MAG: hypothetical protein HYU66_17345 [Armatimonadetes bacterium]|nr:hypothetical protein [Armatimonadota bacterium]
MDDIRARLERLPRAYVDSRWTRCAVSHLAGRVRFRELGAQVDQRRAQALRRRAIHGCAGLLLGALALTFGGEVVKVAFALAASLGILSALDGLARDLRRNTRPFEFAAIDGPRREVELRRPGYQALAVPLDDVKLFLLVREPRREMFHLAVVVRGPFDEDVCLPWMHTSSRTAGNSLCWLFGYLTDRPALELTAAPPLTPDDLAAAQPIRHPSDED